MQQVQSAHAQSHIPPGHQSGLGSIQAQGLAMHNVGVQNQQNVRHARVMSGGGIQHQVPQQGYGGQGMQAPGIVPPALQPSGMMSMRNQNQAVAAAAAAAYPGMQGIAAGAATGTPMPSAVPRGPSGYGMGGLQGMQGVNPMVCGRSAGGVQSGHTGNGLQQPGVHSGMMQNLGMGQQVGQPPPGVVQNPVRNVQGMAGYGMQGWQSRTGGVGGASMGAGPSGYPIQHTGPVQQLRPGPVKRQRITEGHHAVAGQQGQVLRQPANNVGAMVPNYGNQGVMAPSPQQQPNVAAGILPGMGYSVVMLP